MLVTSVKEINSLRKEINSLLSRRMLNIYLEVTTEKNQHSQNFVFLSFKNLSPSQFLKNSNSRRYHWVLKPAKLRGLGANLCVTSI